MKNIKFLLILVVASLISFAQPVFANNQLIAVVDIQRIMQSSTAAQDVRSQLEKKQKAFQDEITKKEKELKKEDEEIVKKKSVLSKKAFEEKVLAFRKKATATQKDVQSKKVLLDNAFQRALNDIQKNVTEIISDIAKEKGFYIALPTSQILYANTALDISDEVLKRLNKQLPKLTVKFK
ncbi:MAG: OmpH family outer membrane protein [Rickettsiales bacterium]